MKNMGGVPGFVEMGGYRLFFWKFGDSELPPIVFLHGLLDEGFGFRRVIKSMLAVKNPIYVFDLPGYGKSKLPVIKYLFQIDVWSEMFLEAFENLNLKKIRLVGHSMGGLTSLHMALLDRKNYIDRLFLLSPGGISHPKRDEIRSLLFPKKEKDVLQLLRHLYGEEAPEPSVFLRKTLVSVWNELPNVYLQENTLRRESEIFLNEKLKLVKKPTLILTGEKDEITTVAMMKKMNRYIPKSQLVIFPNLRHAIHLEKPEWVSKEILKHIH